MLLSQIEVTYPWAVNSETDIRLISATGKIYAVMAERERKNEHNLTIFSLKTKFPSSPGPAGSSYWPHR